MANKNLYRDDPTRTLTLRNKAVSEINRRFKKLDNLIFESIAKNKIFENAEALKKDEFVFLRDDQKLDRFNIWLDQTINELLLSGTLNIGDERLNWYLVYIQDSYNRAVKKTNNDIARILGRNVIPIPRQLRLDTFHVQKLKIMFSRNIEQLRGITETMAQQINRELTSGILQGDNSLTIARRIRNRVDKIGKTRSKLLARTEIMNTHQLASIFEGENLQQYAPDDEIVYRWRSGADDRVRPEHRARNGKYYTKKKVATLTGEPNCRCAVSAIFKSLVKDKEKIQK